MTELERYAKLYCWVKNDPPWLYNLRWRWIVWREKWLCSNGFLVRNVNKERNEPSK